MTLINRREVNPVLQASTWADEFFNEIEQRGEFTEQDLDWLYQNKKLSDEDVDHWDEWSEEVMTSIAGTSPSPAILPTKLTRHHRYASLSNKNIRDDFDYFAVHLHEPVEVPEIGLHGTVLQEPRGALIELEIGGRRTFSMVGRSSISFGDV